MKHTIVPKNTAALLLAAAMLLGLAGCGRANVSAPTQSEPLAEVIQPLQREASAETAQDSPVQGAPADPYARISLDELRAEAKREVEGATFAVAYLEQVGIDSLGFGPTDNATVANYDFIETIDEAHRIDISGGADDAEVYCILPVDPNAGMTVSIVDADTDTVKEEVYRSETGEPILLSCNGGGVLNAMVCFTYGDQVEEFWPMTVMYYGEKRLLGPNGGNYYEFTVFPDWKEERNAYLPAGDWEAEVLQPLSDFQQITMNLYLFPHDGTANLAISDTVSGDYMVGYSGTWALTDDEFIALDLTCTENCTGMEEYDGPIKGKYQCVIGEDGSLTISVSGEGSTPFYVNHAFEPITFYPESTGAHPGDYGYELCNTVLNWYEATTGYRPEYAEVDREEGGQPLIHLYDDMGTHILTDGWYMIDPDTLQGCDYMTGEMIDFSEYTDGIG